MATRQRDAQSEKRDFRQEFTDKVVAAIESGDKLPWEKPWRAGVAPQNAVSGKEYSGMNRLMLGVAMMDRGHVDPRFVTFRQAQSLGGSVSPGEHGVPIEKWERTEFFKRRDVQVLRGEQPVAVRSADGRQATLVDGTDLPTTQLTAKHKDKLYSWREAEAELNVAFAKTYTVFNVEQCKDLKLEPLPALSGDIKPEQRLASIQDAMRADGLKFERGAQAFYMPSRDAVTTPPPEAFKTLGGYQSTMLHEIGHATGAGHRLNRDGITGGHRFGSPGYAREELRAELFSAFAAMQTGITRERDEQHTAYLQSWAQALKNDKHEVFKAASDASKAMDYVLDRERNLGVALGQTEPVRQNTVADLRPGDRFEYTAYRNGQVEVPGGERKTALVMGQPQPDPRWVPNERMPDMMVIPTDNEAGRIHLTSITPIKLIERNVRIDAASRFVAPHPARPDLPGAPSTGLNPKLVPAIEQRSIESERQVTGRFQGVTADDRPGRATIHVLRAGTPLRIDVPAQALDAIPHGLKSGEPIKMRLDPKKGLEIDAGRQQQSRGAALELTR